MLASIASRKKLRVRRCAAFTLVELLKVMAVLAVFVILAFLILGVGSGPGIKSRMRAPSEIQAMSTALESYKTDHGFYPSAATMLTNYVGNDVTQSGGNYQVSAQILYRALAGQTNFTDQPAPETKVYMSFKRNMVGDAAGGSFVKDPQGNPYGYSTGRGKSYPFNGEGFFDLWSTAGTKGISAAETNAWISNW